METIEFSAYYLKRNDDSKLSDFNPQITEGTVTVTKIQIPIKFKENYHEWLKSIGNIPLEEQFNEWLSKQI